MSSMVMEAFWCAAEGERRRIKDFFNEVLLTLEPQVQMFF